MRSTLHLVAKAVWAARDPSGSWAAPSLAAEGFIHCTDGDDEVAAVANRFYRDDPRPYVVVTLDLDRVGSPWRIDAPGTPYPHIYGPVAPDAVVQVRDMPREPDGRFTPPRGAVGIPAVATPAGGRRTPSD